MSKQSRIEYIESNLEHSHYAFREGRMTHEEYEVLRKDAKKRCSEIRNEKTVKKNG